MLKEGDPVRITDLYSRHVKSWIIFLEKNAELSTHLGRILHNELIGKRYGEVINVTRGRVVLLRPTPRDYLQKFRLKTQIMYEDDCAIACSLAGLTNGMQVGEAGTGSGALTLFIANYVAPDGHVYSIDNNEQHQENAISNLSKTGFLKNITFILQDIRQPTNLSDLDAFFLDFSTPFEAIDEVATILKGGGHLICFVPNWGQVEETFARIKENPYLVPQEVFELTRRRFVINPKKHVMRPVFRDLVYSGILIHSIKTIPNMG